MKTISIILAVLILGLSIRPTPNGLCCSYSQSQNTVEMEDHAHCSHHQQAEKTAHSDEDNNNEDSDCSSFCICVCCNISIVVHNHSTVLTSIINYQEPPTPFFFFQYSFEYLPPIWQPPQIG